MKLYAKLENDKSKQEGFGGDKWIEIELSLGNQRIGRIIFDHQGGKSFDLSYEKIAVGRSSEGSRIIDSYDFDCGCEKGVYACQKHAKAKRQKGEKCEYCGTPEGSTKRCDPNNGKLLHSWETGHN